MHASRFLAVALVCVAVSACNQQGGKKELKELTTDVQKGSYALGMDVASYLKRMDSRSTSTPSPWACATASPAPTP